MFKWIIITSLVAVLSFWHIHGSTTNLESHLLHQELFFIPIILASFWFRLPAGIATAIFVSIIYLSSMIPHMENHNVRIAVYIQMALYLFISTLIGWLAERHHKQQLLIIEEEQLKSLTKLASALSSEIQDIVQSFQLKYNKKQVTNRGYDEIDFKEEISKLERLTNAFERFSVGSDSYLLSQDLNEVIKNTEKKLRQNLKKEQQTIKAQLDNAGCPSMVLTNSIVQLLESLVINAMEASPSGSEIIIRSARHGAYCKIEVIDEGCGIKPENIPKLFSPFFTTKENGHGLSLAAGRKIMRECEGDLQFEPGKTKGAIFRLIIPRENRDRNINKIVSEQIPK